MKVFRIAGIMIILCLFSYVAFAAGQQEEGKAPGGAEEAITITYWDQFRPDPTGAEPRAFALWKGLERFQKENPGIKVEPEQVPWGTIERKLIPMASTGETPDVVHIFSIFLAQHVDAGTIAPIDQYIKDWDPKKWLLGWDMWTIDGKVWGIAEEYRAIVLEYRADLLKEAGVEVPKTWHEVGIAAPKLTKGDTKGFTIGASMKDFGDHVNELLVPMLQDAGTEVFDEQFRLQFNNQAGLKVFNTLYDLMYKYHALDNKVIEDDYNTIHQALRAGTLAMGTLGTHRVGTIRQQANYGENFLWAPLPSLTPPGPAPAALHTGWAFSIGKYAKHPEAGIKLIWSMCQPETKIEYAKAGILPPYLPVFDEPWFSGDSIEIRDLLRLRAYIEDYGKAMIWPPSALDYLKLVTEEMQAMWLNRQSPEETLNRIEQRYTSELWKK